MEVIIYKILSPCKTECYIGSTTLSLNRRLKAHKKENNTCKSKKLFEKHGYDNCSIIIVEVCPVEERNKKEQWWLDHSVGVVNYRNIDITEEQRKERKKVNNSMYQQANREKLSAYKRIRRQTKMAQIK